MGWRLPRAEGRGAGSSCLMGTEFRFGKMESSGDGWGRWLHNDVKARGATELDLSNGQEGDVYDLRVLPRIQ